MKTKSTKSSKNNSRSTRTRATVRSGSGGFQVMSLIKWPRIIALVVVMAIVGGYFVWTSQAASGQKSVFTCGSDTTKALANTACADDSAEAVIYRLYAGGPQKRQPDANGFKHWSLELASGKSVDTIAKTFVLEPRTISVSLSNGDFVIRMYERLLGRTPSLTAGGGAYWLGEVNKRGQDNVLASFVATAEVQSKHPGLTVSGAKSLMGLTGKESSLTFVKDLYRYMNNQTGTSADWNWWNNEITSGRRTRAGVLAFFAQTQTAKNYHRAGFIAYVRANTAKLEQTKNEIESKRTATTTGGSTGSSTGSGGSTTSSGSRIPSGGTSGISGTSSGGNTTSNQNTTNSVTVGPNPHVCNNPYPTLSSGGKNNSGGRTDACVSAVQYNLRISDTRVSVSGTIDASTVAAIKSFQGFFKQSVTGVLTPAQVKSIAEIWGAYKTSSTQTSGSTAGTADKGATTTAGGGTGYMDITFIADGSTSQAQLNTVVSNAKSAFSSIYPFSSFSGKIAYHTVLPGEGEFACSSKTIQSADGSFTSFSCANPVGYAVSKGAPTDYVFVVSSGVGREHAESVGGSVAFINPGTASRTMVHEFGHLMGLTDEYQSYGDGSWGEIDLQQYSQCITATNNSNVAPMLDGSWTSVSGPWSEWKSLSGVNWTKGCGDSRWFRPDADSIMHGWSNDSFNSVSAEIINRTARSYVN